MSVQLSVEPADLVPSDRPDPQISDPPDMAPVYQRTSMNVSRHASSQLDNMIS